MIAEIIPMSGPLLAPTPPVIGPARRDEWWDIVHRDPDALPEQTPQWIAAMCARSTYVDASRSYRYEDGRRFVLPLVARRGVPRTAAQLWSYPPAWGIGGPVGDGLDRGVVDDIVADLRAIGAARISIRIDPLDDVHWRHLASDPTVLVVPRTAHVADLHADPETHLATLSKQTRFNIRKAARRGVEVEVGARGDLLDDYYGLFLASVDRWAERQHEPRPLARWRAARRDPLRKLQLMGAHLGDRFRVVVGYVRGRPAAGAIVVLGPTTRYTRGAMDIELVGSTNATDAVQWRALELAYEHGAHRYNMGESGSDAGLARFKERFGASPVQYGEYRFERWPITRAEHLARDLVKRAVRFRD